jgi:thymidine phosphorylase
VLPPFSIFLFPPLRNPHLVNKAKSRSRFLKTGEPINSGEPLFVIHARNEPSMVNITPLLEKAVEVG